MLPACQRHLWRLHFIVTSHLLITVRLARQRVRRAVCRKHLMRLSSRSAGVDRRHATHEIASARIVPKRGHGVHSFPKPAVVAAYTLRWNYKRTRDRGSVLWTASGYRLLPPAAPQRTPRSMVLAVRLRCCCILDNKRNRSRVDFSYPR